VLAQEILAGQLLVEMEDMRRIAIDAADVMTVLRRGSARGRPRQGPKREESPTSGESQATDEELAALADPEAAEDEGWEGDEPLADEA
jgi:hypothetical protein